MADKSSLTQHGRITKTCVVLAAALVVGVWSASVLADEGRAAQQDLYASAAAGDLVEVKLGDLRPTQAVLGRYEVYYKLGRYQAGKDAINKRFDDWCEANGQEKASSANANSRLSDASSFSCAVPVGSETPATRDPMKTGVIGSGGRVYLVDGHHTFTSFMESPDGGPQMRIRVRILGNLSNLGPDAFWQEMRRSGWVWLRNQNNQPITVDQLPSSLGLANFQNDDYRSLIYFTRDIAYTQDADNANYQEFHWGAWLRNHPSFSLRSFDLTSLGGYLNAVNRGAQLMSGLNDAAMVDSGLTAAKLGRINFNSGEFEKLSKNYCDAKPGKVSYADYYYHNILRNPPMVTCP